MCEILLISILLHPLNDVLLISKLEKIVIFSNALQFKNWAFLIDCTEHGIDRLFKDIHSLKAINPIDFKEDGLSKVTWLRDEQYSNAKSPIFVAEIGIAICSNNEHWEKELFPIEVKQEGNVISFNNEHSENAFSFTDVTEEGSETCFKDEHLLKVYFPIAVNEDGFSNKTCSNDVHSLNA